MSDTINSMLLTKEQYFKNSSTRAIPIVFLLLSIFSNITQTCANTNNHQNGNTNGNNAIISPIRNLEASLTAASAQGTVVAVSARLRNSTILPLDDDAVDSEETMEGKSKSDDSEESECVVILSRTPVPPSLSSSHLTRRAAFSFHAQKKQQQQQQQQKEEEGTDIKMTIQRPPLTPIQRRGAIPIEQRRYNNDNDNGSEEQFSTTSRTLHLLHERNGPILACCGLASDARHLIRYTARAVLEHEYIYGGELVDVHHLAREVVADRVRQSAFVGGGGRPMGVEVCLVGRYADRGIRRRRLQGQGRDRRDKLGVYSVDASGNWRHWGSGAACIGRSAGLVRKELYDILNGQNSSSQLEGSASLKNDDDDDDDDAAADIKFARKRPKSWEEALDVAMMALLRAINEESDVNEIVKYLERHEDNSEDVKARYDAVVFFAGDHKKNCCSTSVSQHIIEESFHRCIKQIMHSRKEKDKKLVR